MKETVEMSLTNTFTMTVMEYLAGEFHSTVLISKGNRKTQNFVLIRQQKWGGGRLLRIANKTT